MKEKGKTKTVLYAIVLALFACFLPFINAIVGRFLVIIGLFENVEQLKHYSGLISSFYNIIFWAAIICVSYFFMPNINLLKNIKLNKFFFKIGDNEMDIDFEKCKDDEQTKKEVNDVKQKVKKEVTPLKDNKKTSKQENITKEDTLTKVEKIKESIKEDKKYKFYLAYTISNSYIRCILRKCYDNGIEVEVLKNKIKKYYMKKIKNKKGMDKEEYICEKVANIIEKLKYTDIIEFSDDDTTIIVTEDGKEFLKKYKCEEEV